MNISNVKALRDYLSTALKIPKDSLRIRMNDDDVSQNKTLQHLFEEEFKQNIGKAAVYNCTLKGVKKRIFNYCRIPMELITFVKKNGKKYAHQTKVKTLRKNWNYEV